MKEIDAKKKIQFYPFTANIHTGWKSLLSDPPQGYEFIGQKAGLRHNLISKMKELDFLKYLYHAFLKFFNTDRIWKFAFEEKVIPESSLIYSSSTFYRGKKPFLVDVTDCPYSLSGYNYELFLKNKSKIEDYLSKDNCKNILCPHETCFSYMKENFGSNVKRKLVILRQAIQETPMPKETRARKKLTTFLFMGSINNPDDFYMKGGLEAIYSFKEISKKYPCRLIMRCKIPKKVKSRFGNLPDIKFMEELVSESEIDGLYRKSDILLMPSHVYVLMAFLESMNSGLPIVTLDTYAAKDYVKNNINGFVIRPSHKIKEYSSPEYPLNLRTESFANQVWAVDCRLIRRIAKKLEVLIKKPRLRIKFGDNGRKIFVKKFSTKARNKILKNILDRYSGRLHKVQ